MHALKLDINICEFKFKDQKHSSSAAHILTIIVCLSDLDSAMSVGNKARPEHQGSIRASDMQRQRHSCASCAIRLSKTLPIRAKI